MDHQDLAHSTESEPTPTSELELAQATGYRNVSKTFEVPVDSGEI